MAKKIEPFQVIRDDREKAGWTFKKTEYCLGTKVARLPTADYTLFGLETILAVERKGTVAEIAGNLLDPTFEKELVRLQHFPDKYVVCEFTFADLLRYPYGTKLPASIKRSTKINGTFLLRKLIEFQRAYHFVPILAGDQAQAVTLSIFKRVWESHGQAHHSA